MRSITTEEYEATCKWLRSKISMGEYVSLNDVIIPLEWILELIESASPITIPSPMTTKECISITVKECIKFADYLDYLGLDEFDSHVIIQALESSNNPEAKRALDFISNSLHKDITKLFNKILKTLAKKEIGAYF